jgi:acyl transferase domain-containing protein/NAD(P)H-dependent flavin oxidoreductase YrpB (nitropropane dioxygenase family)/NAD(P)-dependent dehydrogenase (short-subunit alcohol dehydrogenase family)
MRKFRFITLTLSGLTDPSIAIAASRAGEIGVLDLEYRSSLHDGLAAISKLGRFAQRQCGLRLDGTDERFILEVLSRLPPLVQIVILTVTERRSLTEHIRAFKDLGRKVLLETTCIAEARLGQELCVDGLIAKGHEAAGRVGEETTFVLLQRLLADTSLPVWAQGGIGLHSVAACYVAGAAGVVLDAQLGLTRESSLPATVKESIARMDGSETICLGSRLGETYRLYSRPAHAGVEELSRTADRLINQTTAETQRLARWRREIKARVGWKDPASNVWLLGQDAAFAAPLAERFQTVAGVLQGLRRAVESHAISAKTLRPIDKESALARSHGTLYPIVQGPMTRVSDRAAFAANVAEAGGLPFLALALMRAPQVAVLLEETRRAIGSKSWGVGILGFVPSELRREQIEVIRNHRPSFALIAGGRPDQAFVLERDGIPTYLHVPSPGLLKLFVENGARRFVFEGRECGGHVGPRSSFVLWNTMIDTLLETLPPAEMSQCHVLFAGGIHDAVSAAMVAAMAAPLAEHGVQIGLLMGTAYLFTREAVATGAIRKGFQREAIQCDETVLLETGPGHSTRCTKSPFVEAFETEKQRLAGSGKSAEEIREALEQLNIGRLRIASKGITRAPQLQQDTGKPVYLELSEEEQLTQGMYMIGQVAALRNSTCTIAELHHDVSVTATERLASLAEPRLVITDSKDIKPQPSDVAIVGMSCLLPKASDLQTYWENILNKVNAITEVPRKRWDWREYFDEDPKTRDKIYSKWGGFLESVPFDPMRYGMPPNSLTSIEPLQLLTLEAVRSALENAGYADRPFARDRTAVIFGAGGGIADLGQRYALRAGLPMFFDTIAPEALSRLPEWTEDSFAGILLNVAAGRVSNRFDLGGVNYTVDAACASSLAAVYLAIRELENGTSDMVIVGGADTVQNPFGYLCFSKTGALSPRGLCRTFDENADGIVISEGLAVLVLKRLADAERDGDRIYAVIKAVAGSSDGKGRGLTAPRPEGQALALQRAYAKAGFSPATVGLIEAHGTGTIAGDRAEIQTLKSVFETAGALRQNCAIGSVKSNIGHTKCTAGTAGLLKIALALHHKVLPPTINVEKPNSKAGFAESPFYINTELRPWIHASDHPRRAGVSAFGFGGTNFHAVVEEYTDDFMTTGCESITQNWPSELLLWTAKSREDLIQSLAQLENTLASDNTVRLIDLAHNLWRTAVTDKSLRLAIVATSLDDLRQKLASAKQSLTSITPEISDPRGIYFTDQPLASNAKIAFLFPGQGSQSVDMLRDLCLHFPEVRRQFELADRVLAGRFPERLSSYIYPPPTFTEEEHQARRQALTCTNVAQPALAVAAMGVCQLLKSLEVRPDCVAGHSFGEYVALCSGGVFSEEVLYSLAEARGRCIIESATDDLGTMAAVMAGAEETESVLSGISDVWIANRNAPQQTVISGTQQGIEQAVETLTQRQIGVRAIPVACAFHSPLVGRARDNLAHILSNIEFDEPQLEVYSNSSTKPYPRDPQEIRMLLADHLITPVLFRDEIEAMYQAGARIFVEVGPNNILTGLAKQSIGRRPHLAVAVDGPSRMGLVSLQHALAQLFSHGMQINLERLYRGRAAPIEVLERDKPLSPTTWMVDGGSAIPLSKIGTVEETRVKPSIESSAESAPLAVEPTLPAADGNEEVMLQFQRLMKQFLETQQQVMNSYLQCSSTQPVSTALPLVPVTAPLNQNGVEVSDRDRPENANTQHSAPELITGVDHDDLVRKLVQVVSERTGYPRELLDLDLNTEADLGIDSIKRVEILGAFQRLCLPGNSRATHAMMEQLTKARTLRAIVDSMRHILSGELTGKSDSPAVENTSDRAAQPLVTEPTKQTGQSRFLLNSVGVPLPFEAEQLSILKDKNFLITDDEKGVAQALAAGLRAREARAIVLNSEFEIGRRHGTLAGIIHLAPLKGGPHHVKNLFNLVKAAASDLKQADQVGGSWVVAATSAGRGNEQSCSAENAGLAGLIKTLALEWPNVRHKYVQFDCLSSPADLAARLLSEISMADERVEIHYQGAVRHILLPQAAPLNKNGPMQVEMDDSSVILLTGGARGITAEVACELAARYKSTLLLVGRSPLPELSESTETANYHAAQELKKVLMEQMSRTGEKVIPQRIEAAYSALLRDREIRRNLAEMERSGASAHYFQCDVRNKKEFTDLIDRIYERFGRIDGVVHGAGVIEDKLVDDKSSESFDRVFHTKVDSAFVLAERLRSDSLKFLAFFSSVSGVFGNRGQSDYAAANEVLNALATRLDRVWPGRVVALNWGPWFGAGMVSNTVAKQFEERGVEMIRPATGRQMFDDELRYGTKGEVQVILGRGPWAAAEMYPVVEASVPIVSRLEVGTRGGVEFSHQLDINRDLYLQDHRLDGKPVLPAAMAAELMAEVALKGWPEWEVVGVRGFQLLKGIILTNGAKSIRVVATAETQAAAENDELQIDVKIHEENSAIPAYKGTIVLSSGFPQPPKYHLLSKQDLREFPLDVSAAYRELLFHGPRFHCISEFHGISSSGLFASVRTSEPTGCLAHPLCRSWVLDPIVLDAGPQLAILWANQILNMTALPSRFNQLRRFSKLDRAGDLKCYFQVDRTAKDHSILANVYFSDANDQVLMAVEGLESTCSASLNRLAKTRTLGV